MDKMISNFTESAAIIAEDWILRVLSDFSVNFPKFYSVHLEV